MKRLGHYLALIGANASPFADALAEHCADVLLLPPCTWLPRPIASHPDTLLAQLGEVLITSLEYGDEAEAVLCQVQRRGRCRVLQGEQPHGGAYPMDAGYNVLPWGNYVYGRLKSLSEAVAEEARRQGRILRNVRQGYAGCSAISAGNTVISADPALLAAASADGAHAVAISPGDIDLPGYNGGFIGGASGVIGDTAVFFGDPMRHGDGGRILSALAEQGVESVALSCDPLRDVGGVRFIALR